MAPFNTFIGILILAIPLTVAMPRYTETISFQVTSLEASADAHCGYSTLVNSCWRFCGNEGEWCWIQPSVYCERDSDCDSGAACSGTCDKSTNKVPQLGNHRISTGEKVSEFKGSDAPSGYPRLVANQVTFEEATVKAVAPSRGGGFSSSDTNTNSFQATSLEASSDAHCGYGYLVNTCWRICGDEGEWCWIRPSVFCQKDGDCDAREPCFGSCDKGDKGSKSDLGNRRILVKLLIA